MERSDSLVYKISKVIPDGKISVTIKLSDECKNGHQDFSITGNIFDSEGRHISGGCIHDDILLRFPKFKIFVDLHLCDYLGNPMYATANGFYHITVGFGDSGVDREKFCEYYNVLPSEYDILKEAYDASHYGMLLIDLGIPNRWKKLADKAIAKLEKLCEKEFEVNSTKTQFGMSSDKIAQTRLAIANGEYLNYSSAKIEKLRNDLLAQSTIYRDKRVKDAEFHHNVFIWLSKYITVDNFIYYSHSKTLELNYKRWEVSVSQAEIDTLLNSNDYPDGLVLKNKDITLKK